MRCYPWLGVCLLLGVLVNCRAIGMSYDVNALKKAVQFETGCPPEKILVVEAMEAGIGHSKFKMDVCGAEQGWNRYGTSYFPEGRGPMDGAAGSAAGTPGTPQAAPASSQPAPSASRSGPTASMIQKTEETARPSTGTEAVPPVASVPTAPPTVSSNYRCGDFAALEQRVADLELRVLGKKTTQQLIEDLQNPADNAWKLRRVAARELGERKVVEAVPALESILSSPTASERLRREVETALERIRER